MIVVFKSSMRLGVLHWMRNEIYPFQFLLFSYSLSPSLAAGATKETACVPCQAGYYFVFTGSKEQQLECVPMPAVEYLLKKRLSTLIWKNKNLCWWVQIASWQWKKNCSFKFPNGFSAWDYKISEMNWYSKLQQRYDRAMPWQKWQERNRGWGVRWLCRGRLQPVS